MSDREVERLSEDDFADLIAEPDVEWDDAEASASWTSREWGPDE